jgi:hypothetical protein
VSAEADQVLRIATHHEPSSPGGVLAGIRFGTAEVVHTARLVGREVEVAPQTEARPAPAHIHTSSDEVSISGRSGATGDASCRLQLRPTIAQREAALARGLAAASELPPGARVVEWHPTLVRFGAAQLNERFTRATQQPMDADAWVGWLAVKALAEAMLRTSNGDLCATLRRQALDGHKGETLRFDAVSGRLRQPLYIATPATVHAEIEAR